MFVDSDGHANSRFGDGRLVETSPRDECLVDEWDPSRPVPLITAPSSAQIGGPDDQAGIEVRGDVLVHTGEPLTEPPDVRRGLC